MQSYWQRWKKEQFFLLNTFINFQINMKFPSYMFHPYKIDPGQLNLQAFPLD